jgi:hypothetical protein
MPQFLMSFFWSACLILHIFREFYFLFLLLLFCVLQYVETLADFAISCFQFGGFFTYSIWRTSKMTFAFTLQRFYILHKRSA